MIRLQGERSFRLCCLLVMALLAASVMAGCRQASTDTQDRSAKQFTVHGTVEGLDAAKGYVVLNAAAIPAYMDAMTMTFRLKDAQTISELHVGDRVMARLTVDENTTGPAGVVLDQVVVTAQVRADSLPKVQYHVPAVGDAVPDFVLLNQDAKKIHLTAFRGKVLLLTFIYTRCPLANFCPQMSRNFADIDKALAADAKLYAATHLLSVSFDPAYDTPQVLRSYGGAYTGKYTRENFAHWDFAAPTRVELPRIEQWFDLGVTPGSGKSLSHSLTTVVIGKDGKVVAFYPTNDWTPAEVEAKVRTTVGL